MNKQKKHDDCKEATFVDQLFNALLPDTKLAHNRMNFNMNRMNSKISVEQNWHTARFTLHALYTLACA